jgi:hypothetical protein
MWFRIVLAIAALAVVGFVWILLNPSPVAPPGTAGRPLPVEAK